MLSEFPKYGTLSDEDTREWNNWLERNDVQQLLDRAIEKCRVQAEANKDATGYAVSKSVGKSADGEETYLPEIDVPSTSD